MNRGRSLVGGGVLTVLTLAAAVGVLHARDAAHPLPSSTDRLMYLRSGRTASRVFLSFDAVAADVYWIRTIQHDGRDRSSRRTGDRFNQLYPLLDLTTTLDPYFNIAYRFGAIFLAIDPPDGPGRRDQAIALLQKGLAASPDHWQYAQDIGFLHYWYEADYRAAGLWFERASRMPRAPEWIRPLAAVTLAQGGDRETARRMLMDLLSADQQYIRGAAERGLNQLRALDAIDQLASLVETYRRNRGRYPATWADLVQAGELSGVPIENSTGAPFVYDAESHEVSLAPDSPLRPLPTALSRR